ncbi:syntaxin-10 [Leptonychotes weddellii]|uniref:Syntaxin-10 n=1 Tax=Leptonychotes weddellii TaxID=9713 RepID=A0A7F8QD94_LEPWE|nr:syntaxin-10 [Leptonychotes weddellii]
MSLEDPFFVVRGEVQKAVNTARGLYQRWCELLQEDAAVGREELDWTTNELRNGLRSIEWDLEDLEETIGIVEANPGKFKLPAGDLQERKVFVERMREAVQDMKDHMVSPAAIAFMERNNREVRHPDPTSSPEALRETLPFACNPDPLCPFTCPPCMYVYPFCVRAHLLCVQLSPGCPPPCSFWLCSPEPSLCI